MRACSPFGATGNQVEVAAIEAERAGRCGTNPAFVIFVWLIGMKMPSRDQLRLDVRPHHRGADGVSLAG